MREPRASIADEPSAGRARASACIAPFAHVDRVRTSDGRIGTVVGVLNFGEAYQIAIDGIHEIWTTDDLTNIEGILD